jgi:hypothetical protein
MGERVKGKEERASVSFTLAPLPIPLFPSCLSHYPFPFSRHALAILRMILKLFVDKHNMDR